MALQALPAVGVTELFGAAMVAVGLVALLASARYVRRAVRLGRAREVEAGDAEPGALVRVTGEAVADERRVRAPFSGGPAVVLRYAVEERRPSLVLLPWWVTATEANAATAFRVRAAAGEFGVAAPRRTVVLSSETVARLAPGAERPERIAAFEENDGPGTTRWQTRSGPVGALFGAVGLGDRKYVEERLAPGDDVTVVGRLDGGTVDPLVVSALSPRRTLRRMAKTAAAGVAVGAVGLALGAVLLAA